MRKFLISILLSLSFVGSFAQNKTKHSNEEDIFDVLMQKKLNQGDVSIYQSPNMRLLLDKKIAETEDKQYVTFLGYRVQVYMGNNQKKSKTDALEREKKIKERFPSLSAYLSFVSPFWKLRVGDFRTHTEALVVSKQLTEVFPAKYKKHQKL